ncbi:hypothetical protein EsDP_00006244 [Epichloe bromicola]|uniref:Uncharacterized protein n=1 Tax=Epichloe bromicola TaxID=79588 RepID=A0ABQ0CX45_9HYPO
MPAQGPPRADSSGQSTRDSPPRSIKRDARSESPIYLSSSVLITPREARQARRRFFDDLGAGAQYPGMPKPISSADQLTEVQLKKCFDILHACGTATDDGATLETTRASIDGFLDAVFRDWKCDADTDSGLVRPELEFMVEADVIAGTICTAPDQHRDASTCRASNTCKADISASASYSCNPAMLKMEFTMLDPFTGLPEAFCPLGRADIRWAGADWRESLRRSLAAKLLSRMHRYNKHLAVWQARRLIRAWSKGSVCLGPGVADMGFMGENAISLILLALGESD